ncbi:unnamed protein product [Clonostachys rhizophaga]|uniref:Uncharacterized protein n=1 Tax=Clonostachys rhizophaga TaxID=160324 RepID=A0A9N9V0J7_9HYPO|nr:unnamed protein product [Clonostachys rhizophaga]
MDGHMEDTLQSLVTTALHLDMSTGAIDQDRHLDMSIGATDQGRRLDMSIGATDQGRRLDMSIGAIDQDHRAHKGLNVDEQHRLEAMRNRSERREQNSSSHPATSTTLPGGWESTLRPALVDYFGTNSQTTSDGTYKLCAIDNSLGGGPQSKIYTSSQDVATGQALYHMVKGDPKLRDVSIIIMGGALQRQSRSDGFSYGFSVHIRPVYGRISKRDPYKLLFNLKARARSDKKSYEVIEDDIIHAPDPSMGRDEQAHRMNVEPIRESPDMNMTGSTLAGLSSAIEAQSDATAPATATSSNNQGGSKVAADMESTNLHVPEGSK